MISEHKPPTIKLYKKRWYILILFCFNGFLMDVELQVYNAVPQTMEHYYEKGGVTMKQINYSLAVGALTYTVLLFPMMFVESKINNFRFIIVLSSYMYLLGCILRLIPTIFTSQMSHAFGYMAASSAIIYIGSIFTYATPSKLSALWFGENERVLATSLAAICPTIGIAFDYLLFPFLAELRWGLDNSGATKEFHGNMALLLYFELILQIICCLMMTVYFPAKPSIPPSFAENSKREQSKQQKEQVSVSMQDIRSDGNMTLTQDVNVSYQNEESISLLRNEDESFVFVNQEQDSNGLDQPIDLSSDLKTGTFQSELNNTFNQPMIDTNTNPTDPNQQSSSSSSSSQTQLTPQTPAKPLTFLQSLRKIFTSLQMIILLLIVGIAVGSIQAYNNNVTYMLTKLGYSETTGGIVSSIDTATAVLGAMLLPVVMRGRLRKKDKLFYFVIFLICVVAFTIMLLTMPCPPAWVPKGREYPSIIKPTLPIIAISSAVGGTAAGMAYPLFFETAAEITYPVPEIISGSSITFATTVTYFIVIFLFGFVGPNYVTLVAVILDVIGTVLIPFMKVTFKRSAFEEQERQRVKEHLAQLDAEQNTVDNNDAFV